MPTDPFFRLLVADVFSIRDRGTVVTGKIESGILRTGDEVVIHKQNRDKRTVVTGIEAFKKTLEQANPGDMVGILLKNISKQDVEKGDELLSPDSGG